MPGWHLFVYRLPSKPSSARVAVWRDLRRLGALPLQQAVVALPAERGFDARLDAVEARVAAEGGSSHRFTVDGDERLEADLEKLRAWFARVEARDVFAAPGRERAADAIERCAHQLEDFERRVFEAESEDGPSLAPPAKLPWGE